MSFRVTSFAIENQTLRFAARHSADVFRFQRQITSGVRIHRPSDDPIAFRNISSLNRQFNELNTDLTTVRSTEAVLNNSVSQIQEVSQLITSAVTAVQQGIQSNEPTDRNALALEIEGILNQLKVVANTSFNGNYLFAGTRTDQQPFSFDSPTADGRPLSVTYAGSEDDANVLIGSGLTVKSYYNGNDLFGRGDRQQSLVIGNTGAQPGSGTDTLTSRASLVVSHTTTTYAGTSGIVPGGSSNESDTLIGQHELEIVDLSGDGSSGTVSLNGGQLIPFNASQTDLRVEGPTGEVIFVDTTNIAAGFSGTVSLTGNGTLSVDGGISSTAIDFSDSQVVSDSVTNGFITINSQSIRRTGIDHLEFPGTSSAFEILDNLSADLRNVRSLPPGELEDSLDRRFGELESLQGNLLDVLGEQSTTLRTLESVGFRIESNQLETQIFASDLQATDISEAALRLTNAESLLEYTFAVTAQITSIDILDFLR